MVYRTLPLKPMSEAQKQRLAKLASRPDEEIDFTDIPELTDDFFKNAIRNPYYRPIKQQLTVRLDADVIAWLRKTGDGYQTRLNQLLRTAMQNELDQSVAAPTTTTARVKRSGPARR